MTTYATLADLAVYLAVDLSALPTESQRQLNRASELVDQAVGGAIDTTDVTLAAAAMNATTAQVEYWQAVGEDVSIIGPNAGSVAIGTFRMDGASLPELAPRARKYLLAAGLLYRGVSQTGGTNAGLASRFFKPQGWS